MYTILRCLCADSRVIGLPRTATLGHEFLNKKLIRGSRRMDAVAAKSDAVTAWKCTITDAYRRLPTLTGAYGRWFPVRGFCSFRMWPCQTVPQCDWAFRCEVKQRIPTTAILAQILSSLMHASYGVSTLTDAHSQEPTNWDGLTRSRNGVCTLTARSDGMPTRRTVCLHIETVCVHKSATTRARPPVYTTF